MYDCTLMEKKKFKKTPRQMSGGKDGQTLFYRILPATAVGLTSKTAVNWHLKVKDIGYNAGLTKFIASQSACKKSAQFINSFSRF